MVNAELLSVLVKEAESNPASNAVFHVFALRKRARNSVTLTSLFNKMKKEGFDYAKSDYTPVLKLLASIGLGELDVGPKGNVRGLKNIKVTLQSIGNAACKQNKLMYNFRPRKKFAVIEVPAPVETITPRVNNNVNIELCLNGKMIHIPVPREFTVQDIAKLVEMLKSA